MNKKEAAQFLKVSPIYLEKLLNEKQFKIIDGEINFSHIRIFKWKRDVQRRKQIEQLSNQIWEDNLDLFS